MDYVDIKRLTKLQPGGQENIFNSIFHTKVEAKLQPLSQKREKVTLNLLLKQRRWLTRQPN
jgi:hypothetical protein